MEQGTPKEVTHFLALMLGITYLMCCGYLLKSSPQGQTFWANKIKMLEGATCQGATMSLLYQL